MAYGVLRISSVICGFFAWARPCHGEANGDRDSRQVDGSGGMPWHGRWRASFPYLSPTLGAAQPLQETSILYNDVQTLSYRLCTLMKQAEEAKPCENRLYK